MWLQQWVEGAPILTPDQGFTAPRANHSETGDFFLNLLLVYEKNIYVKGKNKYIQHRMCHHLVLQRETQADLFLHM